MLDPVLQSFIEEMEVHFGHTADGQDFVAHIRRALLKSEMDVQRWESSCLTRSAKSPAGRFRCMHECRQSLKCFKSSPLGGPG